MTKNSNLTFHQLSKLIDFPEEGFVDHVNEIQLYLNGCRPECSATLEPFVDFVSSASLDQMQELHTRTFEVQAITTLDLGYLLFGDDYKRAELLVNLSREHQQVNNPCGHELADHLPNVLRLLDKLMDEALRTELVQKLIYPGLVKMVNEFEQSRLNKKNEVYERHHKTLIEYPVLYGTLYQYPLLVLLNVVASTFNIESPDGERTSDFIIALNNEMKLED
jgi:nitrate reductase assembly molybdenum cofactor insertion protein NarJ